MPAGLPEDGDVRIAHKTGTLDTFLHDAGIVYAPGGDFVLVVMTENTAYEAALATIRSVTGAAYEAYAEPTTPGPSPTPTVQAASIVAPVTAQAPAMAVATATP